MCGRYLKPVVLVFLLVAAESIVPAQVTDQDLLKPDPSDWLMYSGSYNSHRHSLLKQITPTNVGTLAVDEFRDLIAFLTRQTRSERTR